MINGLKDIFVIFIFVILFYQIILKESSFFLTIKNAEKSTSQFCPLTALSKGIIMSLSLKGKEQFPGTLLHLRVYLAFY